MTRTPRLPISARASARKKDHPNAKTVNELKSEPPVAEPLTLKTPKKPRSKGMMTGRFAHLPADEAMINITFTGGLGKTQIINLLETPLARLKLPQKTQVRCYTYQYVNGVLGAETCEAIFTVSPPVGATVERVR